MLLEKLLKPLRIGKGLLCLLAMFVMLLAPQGAWATVYTTSTDGPTSATSEGAKFTWTITELNKDLYVYSSNSDDNSVTLSSSPVGLSVYENGCTIKASGIEPKSMYDRLIYKVKLLGNGISNDKIAVYVDDFAFTASSTDGEFYVLNPVSWSSYDELSIEITNSCTITGIQISTSVVDLQDKSYTWPYRPTDNDEYISDAKHNNDNDSIFININEHISYSYEFSVSATYSSSNTGVAEVANDGSVTIKGTGSTTITAAFQNGDNDIIPFSYILTVTDEAVSYGLSVAGVPVTSSNASHILGDNNQSVTYDALKNTLTLNNATITVEEGEDPNEFPCISYSGSTGLTIKLIGDNSIVNEVGVTAIRSYSGGTVPLTFAKGDAQPCSLLMSTGEDSVIDGFSSISGVNGIGGAKGNFLALSNASASYSPSNGLYTVDGETSNSVSSATIISGYDICVEGVLVHEGNKDNVLGDQEETHKVTFTPAVDEPAMPATLTLNGINYSPDDGDTTPLVVSSLDNLTVKLAGSSSVYVSSQAEVYPAAAFVSTNADAVLTFTTDEPDRLQLLNTNSIELASGFNNIVFTGYLYREQNMVKNLLAPTPSMDGKYFTVNRAGYEPEGTTFNYVIDYTDNSASVNGTYDMSKTASENNILLDKPCTVTVYAQYGTVKSAEKEGRLFGFVGGNELNVTYGTAQATMPTLVPAIAEADGITIMKEGNFVDNDKTKINLEGKTIGKASTTIITSLTASNDTPYTLLNSYVNLNVNILPPAPTIAFDADKNYLNSDKVSILLPEVLQNDENASIKYSWDEICEPGNGSNYTEDSKVALNAGTNTLYAWVRYNGATINDAVYSERVSQEFTVKTDIDQLVARDLIDFSDTTYTGKVIVPTFTLRNAKDETQTLSADNYDVRIEKYVDENTDYAVVESIVDAGQYMVYAVGKGDNYGGEKIIYERITVLKASLGFVKVEEVENAIYNGDEQQLVTVSNLPEGATVEYIWQPISEDNFNDGSFDLMCCVDGAPFTQSPPTSTNVGYFAFVYRLKGGANYNDTYASGTIKVALYPATVTKVTLAETTLTYNSSAQTPTIASVKAGDALTLTTDDYTVSYEKINGDETTTAISASDVKAVGSYNVVVTGTGNFKETAKAPFAIVNRTLADNEVTFHKNWATFYNAVGDVDLPAGIGAFIPTAHNVAENTIIVTPIKNVPQGEAVLLSNDANVVTQTENTSVEGNMLRHTDKNIDIYNSTNYYGLYNGTFMRVKGTISAESNYLLIDMPQAPQLTIVFDGGSTGINDVRSKKADVRGDFYDLQGRKVEKPSKKGLYINEGHKVVVK